MNGVSMDKEREVLATIPDLVRKELLKIDEKSEIFLFGSRARGDFREDSDWDFLVLLNKRATSPMKDLIREKLYDLELATDQVISSIIYEKDNWAELGVMPLHQIISEEGIEV